MTLQQYQIQSPALLCELEDELSLRMGYAGAVLDAIVQVQQWAGMEPYLIKLLSAQLTECLPLATRGEEGRLVDELVQRNIVEDWRHNAAADHLLGLESMLLSYPQVDSLLILYLKVLQRGETEADNSPEQAALVSSGLVVQEGQMLRVANAIYESVFDLSWLERQIPGITKPVSIVRSGVLPGIPPIEGSRRLKKPLVANGKNGSLSRHEPDRAARATRLYSKVMVLACCLAVIAAAAANYFQESGKPAMASLASLASGNRATVGEAIAQQQFDNGIEHAKNSRWLMMLREFCLIPEDSIYFKPAQQQMEGWVELYSEEIEVAKAAFLREGAQACKVMPRP